MELLASLVLGLSVAFQALAAIKALTMIAITGRKRAWILISLSLSLMILRRIVPIANSLLRSEYPIDLANELIGLTLSILMYEGVRGIEAIFKEHKAASDEVIGLLAEKGTLLREVHHRIKNNMNTMQSLLSLQANTAKEPAAAAALEEAAGRLRSMEVLYEQLYQSPDFSELSVRDYLNPLIDRILENFPLRAMVESRKDVEDFVLDVKRLQTMGIIVNELLTNCMKYAFAEGAGGLVAVTVRRAGGRVVAEVKDNGRGIPESVDFDSSEGFGMVLVAALVRQLDGAIRITREGGTAVAFEFPL